MEYLLPWHGQLMVSVTLSTGHPEWVHATAKPLNSPAVGCVTTTPASAKTTPPPTGTSEVDPIPAAPAEGEGVPEPDGASDVEASTVERHPELEPLA